MIRRWSSSVTVASEHVVVEKSQKRVSAKKAGSASVPEGGDPSAGTDLTLRQKGWKVLDSIAHADQQARFEKAIELAGSVFPGHLDKKKVENEDASAGTEYQGCGYEPTR